MNLETLVMIASVAVRLAAAAAVVAVIFVGYPVSQVVSRFLDFAGVRAGSQQIGRGAVVEIAAASDDHCCLLMVVAIVLVFPVLQQT